MNTSGHEYIEAEYQLVGEVATIEPGDGIGTDESTPRPGENPQPGDIVSANGTDTDFDDSELTWKEPWEKQKGESTKWFSRFTTYLLAGPDRKLAHIARAEGVRETQFGVWKIVAKRWNWKKRAEAWDIRQVEERQKRAQEVLRGGLALDYERVALLKKNLERHQELLEQVQNELENDAGSRRSGLSRRLEVLWKAISDDLDAIAKETGGRIKRVNYQRDLTAYAIEIAREEGFDEATAIEYAKQLALEAKG